MKNIKWEVRYTFPPTVRKHCKKCGTRTEYLCSGLFRVNAQRKYLDIWLIYKCEKCSSTWNMTIHSRINPKNTDPALLEKFHRNDRELARKYAMDAALLSKNGVAAGETEYEVLGEDISISEPVRLEICSEYSSSIKVSAILRKKLGLSKKILTEWIEKGVIFCESGQDISKCKLQKGIVLTINPNTKSGLKKPDFTCL